MGEENQNDDPGKENTAENDCVEVTDRRVVPPIKIVISKQRRMSVKSKYPKTESIRLSQLLENTLNVSKNFRKSNIFTFIGIRCDFRSRRHRNHSTSFDSFCCQKICSPSKFQRSSKKFNSKKTLNSVNC